MPSQKAFKENLEAVSSIKTITSIYLEIASMRVNQLKDKVARTREFLDGVGEIYNRAKADYISILQKQALKRKANWRQLKFIKRNGKAVMVFLSANEHLYGELILNVWQKFKDDVVPITDDVVVVGSFGKYLVKNEENIKSQVTYFELNDDKPQPQEIKKILDFVSKYEQIFVYYGQLVTVLNQIPKKEQISGGITLGEKPVGRKYLFEPSPQKILEFFETEIITALFNQKIYDHQLARFAARMVAMDQANENAEEILENLDREYKALRRRVLSRKQLEVFSGFSLWSESEGGVSDK